MGAGGAAAGDAELARALPGTADEFPSAAFLEHFTLTGACARVRAGFYQRHFLLFICSTPPTSALTRLRPPLGAGLPSVLKHPKDVQNRTPDH